MRAATAAASGVMRGKRAEIPANCAWSFRQMLLCVLLRESFNICDECDDYTIVWHCVEECIACVFVCGYGLFWCVSLDLAHGVNLADRADCLILLLYTLI